MRPVTRLAGARRRQPNTLRLPPHMEGTACQPHYIPHVLTRAPCLGCCRPKLVAGIAVDVPAAALGLPSSGASHQLERDCCSSARLLPAAAPEQ